MSVTLQAAVHLDQDYSENPRSIKNQPLMSVKQLFRTTEKLITDQKEITCIPVIDWNQPMWIATTLFSDRAVQFTKFQTYVFADSVLCLEGKSTEQVQAWKDEIEWYLETRYPKDVDRIDGDPMEFEWKKFP